MEKQNYNFATAISMVIGCVIGSGIFFKADDILIAVNGNVALGLLGFFIVGVGVLFGALAVSYYAEIDKNNEGLIGYARMAAGRKFSFVVGWLLVSCYFPTLMVILALITAGYLGMLLGIDSQLYITVATFVLLATNIYINIKMPKAAGKIQVFSTVAKMIPLVLIGLIGALFFSSPNEISMVATNTLSGGKPMSALIAIAFAFDGWIVATNIADDLEDSKRNLPRALAWGSVAIMVIYSLYFFGLTQILSPSEIVSLGDDHIMVASQMLVGAIGSKLILIFIVISVYGGFNGMTLAFVRVPEEMMEIGLMKTPTKYKDNMFKYAVMLVSVITLFWFVFEQLIDYGLVFVNLEDAFDISSMPIVIIYIVYIVLFLAVNKFVTKESAGRRIYFVVISLIATITSLMIIGGSLQVNGLLYIVISIVIIILGIPLYQKTTK